ncbi:MULTISPECIES: PTS sugar transporter subunit IIA [Aerococcus]|uniref:PTS sugar transporter subunit IIA n=1 Tax=Aerococcus mictus TaxID=2976810 RepID=A0ABZ2EFU9_9LACT|nr:MULTISPECIES: PTS sugar transporter subunit IIA [Aerococcus]MDK6597483.1 PTS sugar transporter subunit IIA [Aerococcus urinae]MDK7303427.1 PTS sugar transporter subunit IIA [Aerococcus urinae]MDL5174917.1 PTS sugar transporter subunit IIA [Aerococcus mictus]RAV69889.1 hypothetical protein DBT40_08290 [Aerococcus urinae]RAW04143.1 hypothetical protein DBT41_08875 [Aerococcus urinae]
MNPSFEGLVSHYPIESVKDRFTVYEKLEKVCQKHQIIDNDYRLTNEFLKREIAGDIEIAPGVVMPHWKDSKILESKIIISPLRPSLAKWNEEIDEVALVITVIIKENENETTLKQIISFIQALAKEEFINQLLNGEDFEK